ncbi:MAG: hypothetical protein JRJ47_04980 [Deltaproteobacteria bacterium]|nr:hypothetical protein [Deltaproteobacteria bacterium]
MTEKKDEFVAQMKKQYDDLNYRWGRQRDKIEADLQHASGDVRKEYEEKREAYRKFRNDLKEKIIDLEGLVQLFQGILRSVFYVFPGVFRDNFKVS